MNPKRWRQIKQIYHSALELEPGRREAFFREACAGDESLLKEVTSLLAQDGKSEEIFDSPAINVVAKAVAEDEAQEPQQILTGHTLLHYQIEEKIGEGGMGIVYRAHDTHLKRDVAVKVLPDIFARDGERLARFEREARIVAALSHPNILGIHDLCSADGISFAVMELLEGATLRERVNSRELPVRNVIECAVQMAQGLAAAHDRGVVHRDLKPENVFITKEGRVKILDFGLAKLRREPGTGEETNASFTRPGELMGTVGYMSPEQVRGQDADARSDIFALGAVLYEMLSGQRAFRGDSEAETISAILKEDPRELKDLQKRVTPAIEGIVRRCLEKNPDERFQSARDLGFALEALFAASGPGDELKQLVGVKDTHRRAWAVVTAGVLVVVACVSYWISWRGSTKETTDAPMIPVPFTTYPGEARTPTFSPDGNQVAFSWNGANKDNFDIYIKQIGSESRRRLTTDPSLDSCPAWSPDNRSIAFVRMLGSGLSSVMLIPVNGGRERKVTDSQEMVSQHLCWYPNGSWLAVSLREDSPDLPYAIFLLEPETGERRQLTFPPKGTSGDRDPSFSPDGRTLGFVRDQVAPEIFVLPISADLLPEGKPKQITFDDRLSVEPVWMPNGREIVYASGSKMHDFSLWRIPVSDSGRPNPLSFSDGLMSFDPAVSVTFHRLIYKRMFWDLNIWRCRISAGAENLSQATKLVPSTRVQESAQYSPDGKSIAYVAWTSGTGEIWVCDVDGLNPSQLTHSGGRVPSWPHWSPDGRKIVFGMAAKGKSGLFVISAQGGEVRQLALTSTHDSSPTYSRDGRWIYFDSDRSGDGQVWRMPAEGGAAIQLTRRGGGNALESMDGKTVFYLKGDNPDIAELWRVPTNGGDETRVLGNVLNLNFDVSDRGIYYVSRPSKTNESPLVQFYDFASGNTRQIGNIDPSLWVGYGFSVSRDEQWFLLPQGSRDVRADLMLVENFR